MTTAKIIMDNLRISLSKINHNNDGRVFNYSFSCGIASFPKLSNATTLNEEADKALFRAKKDGRNQVCCA
ncbi:MAG: PleD family two-component response regulator [Motiliproteus sp.]